MILETFLNAQNSCTYLNEFKGEKIVNLIFFVLLLIQGAEGDNTYFQIHNFSTFESVEIMCKNWFLHIAKGL